MELANVELGAKGFFCSGAQLLDLELADLVSERLGRPDDVAVDLADTLQAG